MITRFPLTTRRCPIRWPGPGHHPADEQPLLCRTHGAYGESGPAAIDDMLKNRGVNVFPSQIEEVLINTEGIGPNYDVLDRRNHSDILTIKVEVEEAMMGLLRGSGTPGPQPAGEDSMMLGLDAAAIQLVSPNTLRFEGKRWRVTDLENDPKIRDKNAA